MATKKVTHPTVKGIEITTIVGFELVSIGNRWNVKTLYSDKSSRLDLVEEGVSLLTPDEQAAYIEKLTWDSGIVF